MLPGGAAGTFPAPPEDAQGLELIRDGVVERLVARGRGALNAGDPDGAADYARRALAVKPAPAATALLADALAQQGAAH